MTSPFFHPGTIASTGSLAILHLRRDHLLPTILHEPHQGDTEYAEGHVVNTRFGSYPHSTLIGTPWGSQVLASQVDTGSRGRDGAARGKKRKLVEVSGDAQNADSESQELGTPGKQAKAPVTASSGFCHIMPPTPETWTISLPHRTQVVYTPDYSFVLQKLQVRPGSVVIEAGAGSGSFTHAAARAVFDGYLNTNEPAQSSRKTTPQGKVYSFEYHEPRAHQLQTEIESHGLSSVVRVTHRDVYRDGFLLPPDSNLSTTEATFSSENLLANETSPGASATSIPTLSPSQPIPTSPAATAIFLDLPAPWLAFPHLSRHPAPALSSTIAATASSPPTTPADLAPSPLSPTHPAHLCCFLPCIEQAQRCIAALRTHGWLSITMFELCHRRLDVRRERVGLGLEGLRGVNASPASVEEAVERLVEVERVAKLRTVVAGGGAAPAPAAGTGFDGPGATAAVEGESGAEAGGATDGAQVEKVKAKPKDKSDGVDAAAEELSKQESRAARLARIAREAAARKPWQDGRVTVRTEPEVKTHTSYLVFAILPIEWTEESENRERERWPIKSTKGQDGDGGEEDGGGKRQKGRKGKNR